MGRSFGTGLAKLLTSVAVLGKELFLNAFSKDPKINTYLSISGLVDLGLKRRTFSLLDSVFSFLLVWD